MWRGGVVTVLLVGLVAALIILARRCEPEHHERNGLGPSRDHESVHASSGLADGGVKPRPIGGLRLEGQAIDNRDEPVEGATIHLSTDDGFAEDTTSGGDGTFAFERLARGRYWISALKGDLFSYVSDVGLSATTEPVVLQLVAGHPVVVRVSDAASRQPIAGARIMAWASVSDSAPTRRCTTGDDGSCALRGMGFGLRINSWTSHAGYERRMVGKLLELDPATADEMIVELRRGASLSGIVIDKNRAPAAGHPVGLDSHDNTEYVDSGTDGRWRFDAVAPGPHQLSFHDGDRLVTRMIDVDGAHPMEGIELVVNPPDVVATLAGIVVDEADHPVEGVKVYARMYEPLRSDEATTDAAGHFTVKLPPERAFHVSAWKDELVGETTISEVERRAPLRIVVHRAVIEGDAFDHRGKPVANAQILESRMEVARSDAHGHFVVNGVRGESTTLVAVAAERRHGGRYTETTAKVGDKHVRLTVDDVSSVVGRVELDGKPLDSYTLSLTDGSQYEFNAFSDEVVHAADGHFALHGLPAGQLQITIKGVGFPPKELSKLAITAGRDIDLGTITLDRGQTIRGRVLDSLGAPVPGATVTVHHHGAYSYMSAAELSADGSAMTKSDAAGNFTLTGFEANETTRIVAQHPTKGSSGERPVDPRTTSIDLILRSTGAIDGTIEGFTYLATVSRVDDRAYSAVCDVDRLNHFSCEDLEPGAYVVFFDGEPGLPKRVNVRAGERAQITLVTSRVSIAAVFDLTAPCSKITLETADEFHDLVGSHDCTWPAFRALAPGPYRVCLDGMHCTPITLADTPEEQHFRVP